MAYLVEEDTEAPWLSKNPWFVSVGATVPKATHIN